MRESFLQFLLCPFCSSELAIKDITRYRREIIETAQLHCQQCETIYPILRGIPRFVPRENYASSFGLEWSLHAKTQYDSYTGFNLSERRFHEATRWPWDLTGQTVLEVGSGSGRFTEQAAATGALIVSMDYSYAVDVNYQSNGNKANVFIVQADVYRMPFKLASKVVLFWHAAAHTSPQKSFFIIAAYVETKWGSGGRYLRQKINLILFTH